jgi:glycerol kinase
MLSAASTPVSSSFPAEGWVEQDPAELVETSVQTMRSAVEQAGISGSQVRGIGIANQTETFVVWSKETGRAVYPAIVWQCRRTAAACARLLEKGLGPRVQEATGLRIDPTFSATKLRWVLENVQGAADEARSGRLAFGDIASWLIWNLTGGATHVTEPSNASRTMLFHLDRLAWDEELLELFEIPRSMLPEVLSSDAKFGQCSPEILGASVPITAALGDQQAALFGQRCWRPGETKVTLGTGAFVWSNAGPTPPRPSPGILGTCAWKLDGQVAYAREGFVPTAGAVVSWLVDVGVLSAVEASERLASAGDDGHDEVVFVPALSGVGTPWWVPTARGALFGISRGTTAADVVRAALEGVAHEVTDAIEALEAAVGGPLPFVRIDGAMVRNDWLAQRLADLTARTVDRPANPEATGIGAACVAGLAAGVWGSREDLREMWQIERTFEPRMAAEVRGRLRRRWQRALKAVTSL